MNKLKTLKDITRFKVSSGDLNSMESDKGGSYLCHYELRQEAIKHMRKLGRGFLFGCGRKFGTSTNVDTKEVTDMICGKHNIFCKNCERGCDIYETSDVEIANWIKYFFNITEKELKNE